MAGRLLIVDDHAAFRRSARRLLEFDGWDVVGEAGDGASGIATAGVLRPDVVLLDVNLPDQTGFDVARALCALDAPPRVVLTSDSDPADIEPRVEPSGASAFIPKQALSAESLRAACHGAC
jgi:DNA-binding NarL/FixJ family response regulator